MSDRIGPRGAPLAQRALGAAEAAQARPEASATKPAQAPADQLDPLSHVPKALPAPTLQEAKAGATVRHLGGFKADAVLEARQRRAPEPGSFEDAMVFAAELHAGQTRKGKTTPYLAHLMAVAAIVYEAGGDEKQAIGGLLHDAVEDQGGKETLARIRARFGDAVGDIVAGCSDTDVVPKPPWRERKEAYVRHLAMAPVSVRLVSGADKLHNVRDLIEDFLDDGDATFERFKGKKEGTLWYYRACADALLEQGPAEIASRLDRAVRQLERLALGEGSEA